MMRSSPSLLQHVVFVVAALWLSLPAWGQAGPAQPPASSAAAGSQETARREILESERWRQLQRTLDEWLSVQQIYTPAEVAAMREEYRGRIASMSPRELNDLMTNMEERLAVLLSPAAKDARLWLNQFFSVARNPVEQLGRPLPDVANMTASQIRQEIHWLEQHRAARQQAQSTFDRTRELQLQSARDMHASRQQAIEQNRNRTAWPANTTTFRSQFAPQRELRPAPLGTPIYSISPWGTPIHWNPLRDTW
jgi:hypothetical protein